MKESGENTTVSNVALNFHFMLIDVEISLCNLANFDPPNKKSKQQRKDKMYKEVTRIVSGQRFYSLGFSGHSFFFTYETFIIKSINYNNDFESNPYIIR